MKIIVVDIHGTPYEISTSESYRHIDQDVQPKFDVFAKWSGNHYFVLASNEGNLFNPLDTNISIYERDRERGGMFWKLRTCSQECYQQYTIFLRSKHKTPYLLAQRRFRNDFC